MLAIAMCARALVRGWALGVCLCLLCAGQISFDPRPGAQANQPNQPHQVRTLSGTVVNSVTGEPIPRALVRVLTNQGLAVLTGGDGHFDIQNVPADRPVAVAAERPGYGQNGQPWAMPTLMIGPGENNVTIKLVPQGGIHGRILDDEGQPIEGIQVQATTELIIAGRKREQLVPTVMTDENGEYEMDGLAPGTYFLHTVLHPLYMTPVPLAAAQQAYPSEFYPDAPDRSAAQGLSVQPGQTAEADFTLKPVRTFRITGMITGGSGPWALIALKGPDGERIWNPGVRFERRTGQFTLSRVPAGSWTLEVRMNPQGGGFNANSEFLYGEQQVQVESEDIHNLQISLQPLAPIPVNVVHAPDVQSSGNGMDPPRRPQPQIQLIPHDFAQSGPFSGTYSARPSQQQPHTPDTLEIRGVPPGSYHVAVHTFGSECLDTITSGSTDLTTQDLTVSAGASPQPITVTLRGDCATLSGVVHAPGRNTPVQVLMIPESGALDPLVMSTSPESQFRMAGVTPGSYRVYAFSTLDGLEYTNPDALRDFEAQEVTVGANQTANVTLNLIERGEQ